LKGYSTEYIKIGKDSSKVYRKDYKRRGKFRGLKNRLKKILYSRGLNFNKGINRVNRKEWNLNFKDLLKAKKSNSRLNKKQNY
jgi:hypothetical protein